MEKIMILKFLLNVLFLLSITNTFAMQKPPQRHPQVQVAPAKLSTWQAASKGDLNTLQNLLQQHPEWVEGRDPRGLTPLAWAVINNQLEIMKWLVDVKRADVRSKDNAGEPILHKAARTGNKQLIQFLLDRGAQADINVSRQEKGRTPLAEVMRASKDAIIHLDIEKENLNTPEELKNRLPAAIKQLADKEAPKLSTNTTIEIINLLKQYGAQLNLEDATGRTPDFYINNVQLISEQERKNLLTALQVPITPRSIQFSEADLPFAIQILKQLADGLEKKGLKPKINKVMWAIQAAQEESDRARKSNILRVAMALLSNVKEEVKNVLPDKFTALEPHLDRIRTILRDTILILTGKVSAPSKPLSVAPAGQAPQQAQPVSAAAPAPALVPRTAQPPAAMPAQVITGETARLLKNILNKSDKKVDFIGNLDGQHIKTYLNPRGIAEYNQVIDNGWFTFVGLGTIIFNRQGITIQGNPTVSHEEFVNIVINNDNTLSIQPA